MSKNKNEEKSKIRNNMKSIMEQAELFEPDTSPRLFPKTDLKNMS